MAQSFDFSHLKFLLKEGKRYVPNRVKFLADMNHE